MSSMREAVEPLRASVTMVTAQPSERTEEIRLLIVDENPFVRCGLAHVTASVYGIQTVGEAASAPEAIALVAGLEPDVVTIDCSLSDGAGWQLARDLRDRHPALGIVMLTPRGSDDLLFRALESGASAFLGDSAPVHEVLSAIRHCAVAPSSFSATGLAQALQRRKVGASYHSHSTVLSTRERQVIGLLREGRTVPQVAVELFVSLSTAKTYVARVYEKLGANNRSQALMTAVRLGLFD
jgi:DNA-binding NarL/FixJ family response regulator